MGVILIVAGAALLVIGIVMTARKNDKKGELSYAVAKNEKNSEQPYVLAKNEKNSEQSYVVDRPNANAEPMERTLAGTVSDSPTIDDPKQKGDNYEDFVVNLLADWRFGLLNRTQDKKSSAGVVAESSKDPDLHVKQKRGKDYIDYYIECKYRSRWKDGKIEFENWQLNRYRKFQRDKHRKVLIALGVGGTASRPDTLMIVPLDSIKGNAIRQIDTKYMVQPNSDALYSYMNTYFTSVFDKARQ